MNLIIGNAVLLVWTGAVRPKAVIGLADVMCRLRALMRHWSELLAPEPLPIAETQQRINLQAQYDLETTYRDMHERIEAEVTPLATAA